MSSLSLVADAAPLGPVCDLSLSWSAPAAARHALRVLRRRLGPPLGPSDGPALLDLTEVFPPDPAAPFAVVDRWRFLQGASGDVGAEWLECYAGLADSEPKRVVVRVYPSSADAPATSDLFDVTRVTRATAPGPGFQSVTTLSIFAAPAGGAESLAGTIIISTQPDAAGPITIVTDYTGEGDPRVVATGHALPSLFAWTPATAAAPTLTAAFSDQALECLFAVPTQSATPSFSLFDCLAPKGRAGFPLRIIDASAASPIRIATAVDHGLASGDFVSIVGAAGNTAANGSWQVEDAAVNQFSLAGSSGNGVYAGGGVVYPPLNRTAVFSEAPNVATGLVDCVLTVADGAASNAGAVSPASELQASETYYYAAFQSDGGVPFIASASATATGSYGFSQQLYEALPAIHRYYDDPANNAQGQWRLRRFLEIFGPALDQVRGLSDALPGNFDILSTRAEYLPALGVEIGWPIDRTLSTVRQRQDLRFAPEIYGSIGAKPNIEALAKRATGWNCRAKEFVDNVFLANAPESVRLWQIFAASRANAAAAFTAPGIEAEIYPAPAEPFVTAADPTRVDARPSAAPGPGGVIWLFWHSTRLGSEWVAGTHYVAGAAPSVLAPLAADGLVFVCTTGGAAGAAAPAFPSTPGATVADGAAIWTCQGPGVRRRRVWLQRLGVDPTPVNAVADLDDPSNRFDEAPSAVKIGADIVLAWSSNRGGHIEIWTRTWSGGATAPGPARPLTNQKLENRNPALATSGAAGAAVEAFWESHGPLGSAIWSAASADGGASWSAAAPVSSGPLDRSPAAVVDPANAAHVFWASESGGASHIRQAVAGASGWTASDVTTAEYGVLDRTPAAVVWNGAVWLFWASNRFAVPWRAATFYAFQSAVTPPTPNGLWHQCVAAGVSGPTAPLFPTTVGARVTDGQVEWLCRGALPNAVAARANRIWQTNGPAFAQPSLAFTRISNDRQPAAVVDGAGALRLFFASQESGARFRSRTFDTRLTPASDRNAEANALAKASRFAFTDRQHYTYDIRRTQAGLIARDTIGLYLDASSAPATPDSQAIVDRARASLSAFRPLTVRFVYFLNPAGGGAFAQVGADP